MGRLKIPFYYCKSRVPLVIFRLRGEKTYVGLIDTGSEITMFDPSMKDEGMSVDEIPQMTSFVGVNGDGDPTSVFRASDTIRFKTKDEEMVDVPVTGIFYDMTGLSVVFEKKLEKKFPISAIFGADFLKDANAKIDFRSKTLTIDN